MSTNETNYYVEALFQQSIDVDMDLNRITVYANLLFRNLSRESLPSPSITLQVTPTSALISGKILSPELVQAVGVYTRNGKQTGWKFTTSDWFKEARADGKYHIEPIEALTLHPGVWGELKEWQVEVDIDALQGPLSIQGSVEVAEQSFPVMNPIQVHFNK
ncbi:MAG: D-Tyr-tRNAtyr deacylase [Paenibacillus sp.]|nr:D-Tyr-tRNAtyr deacylase [Paenibacillus sp.]